MTYRKSKQALRDDVTAFRETANRYRGKYETELTRLAEVCQQRDEATKQCEDLTSQVSVVIGQLEYVRSQLDARVQFLLDLKALGYELPDFDRNWGRVHRAAELKDAEADLARCNVPVKPAGYPRSVD